MWGDEDETNDDMQYDKEEEQDLLCPNKPVSIEERKNLCNPW